MAEKLSVPLLNRLVDAMLDRADPKADQNIWDLARAAEEVMRAVKGEQLTAAYGGPPALTTFTGRLQAPSGADHTAQLGAIKRLVFSKTPELAKSMSTRDAIDQIIQDRQAAIQSFEEACREITKLNQGIEQLRREMGEKESVVQGILDEIREALDPDGQFEAESLIVLARERMNALAARKQDLVQLQERISTQIEANSAEMLRRVLGAAANETLGAAAKRVREERDGARSRVDREIGEHVDFEREIRKLVRAQPEIDSDDCYCPEQPTLDAVNRVIQRLMANESRIDGSLTQEQVLDEIQQGWHDDNHGELQL